MLRLLVGALIVSTAVHYTDNAFAIEHYPGTEPGGAVGVVLFWIGFTASGLLGYRLYERGREPLAQVLLAVFSYSGISSLGHYLSEGGSRLAAWQHVSISLDGLIGFAVLGFAIWSFLQGRRRTPAAA